MSTTPEFFPVSEDIYEDADQEFYGHHERLERQLTHSRFVIGSLALTAAVLLVTAGCATRPRSSPPPSSKISMSVAASVSSSASAAQLIDHVHWGTTGQGAQLQVFPTAAGRTAPGADSTRAWAEILADAPTADTPGMREQFLCHWTFARVVDPAKPSWNLEPWRPAVGYAATVAASCNPGGAEE